MKVLVLSNNFFPDIGGIEVNSEILSRAFTDLDHEVHVITWSQSNYPEQFPFEVIRNPSVFTLFSEYRWADFILENNPCLKLSWPNIFFNKKNIIVLNTWISRVDGTIAFQDRLKLLWLKRADKVIAVSNVIKDQCFKEAIVIENPYNAEQFKIKAGEREKAFVFLGRLVSDKGVELAIKAFREILNIESKANSEDRTFQLTIIGDGPEMASLKNLVSTLGIDNFVQFTGFLSGEALVKMLNEHRFLIVPSIWKEPFGNVALEGLACGCIPIVADGGGLPDAVGNAGLIFERGNLDSLVQSLKRLLEEPVLEAKLRQNAISQLAEHHPDVVIQKYLSVIENIQTVYEVS